MKMHFDVVTQANLNLSTGIHEDLLSVHRIDVSDLTDRVPSSKTLVIALPDVTIPTEAVASENLITVLLEPVDFDQRTTRSANLIAQLVMSKAIACDHTTWKSLHCSLSTNKRWIDLTGTSLATDSVILDLSTYTGFGIHYYGKKSAFTEFLEQYLANGNIRRELCIMTPDDLLSTTSIYSNTIAITTDSRSRLFMDTLATRYPMVLYPVSGNNEAHICALDSRGASSVLASVKHLEDLGVGRSKDTVSKWDNMMTEVGFLLRSLKTYPYMTPCTDNLFRRIFNETNRSGF